MNYERKSQEHKYGGTARGDESKENVPIKTKKKKVQFEKNGKSNPQESANAVSGGSAASSSQQEVSCDAAGQLPKGKTDRGVVKYRDLPGGVLDPEIISGDYDAIAQRTNCVGRYPIGLALGIEETLPYGSPYKERRPDRRRKQFAMTEDCSEPGTIQVRTEDSTRPDVIQRQMAMSES